MSGPYPLGHDPFRHDDAACRGVDPSLFFPDDEAGSARAKAVCAVCPVSVACLDHAIAHGENHGVWGGMTTRERWVERDRREGKADIGRVCVDCGIDKPLSEYQTQHNGRPVTRCNPCRNDYLRPVAAVYRRRKRAEREGAA